MNFLKQDLAGDHYSWINSNNAEVFTGSPSRRLFDRFNGDQVLFIINFFGAQSDKFTLQEARLMEDHIAHYLPLEAKSEISVLNWLQSAVSFNK
jgi:hypothetical protein